MYNRFSTLFLKIDECITYLANFFTQASLDSQGNPRNTSLLSRCFQDASNTPPRFSRSLQDVSKMLPSTLQAGFGGPLEEQKQWFRFIHLSKIRFSSNMLPKRFQDVLKTPWKPSGAVLDASCSLWDRLLDLSGKLLERSWTVPEASRDLQEHPKNSKTLLRRPKTPPRLPGSV